MMIKRIFALILSVALCCLTLAGCEKADETPAVTAPATTAVLETETVTEAAAVTTAVSPTETAAETPTETTPPETTVPETEATTTASITTADNSSDTRTSQQKLDDLIAANPDVEIGYALVEANFNSDYYNALFSYNLESKIPYADTEDFVILADSLLNKGNLDGNEGFLDEQHIGPEDTVNSDSEMCRLYREEGKWKFKFKEVVNYFLQGDEEAKAFLKYLYNYSTVDNVTVEFFYKEWERVSDSIRFWQESEDRKENAPYVTGIFSNTDRNAFFYEGTGVVVTHWGNINADTGVVLDSGLITINDKDIVFVILARSESGDLRTDLVSDISRILYDDFSK
jgi:hypothetical protein